jgi:hypothetical protein
MKWSPEGEGFYIPPGPFRKMVSYGMPEKQEPQAVYVQLRRLLTQGNLLRMRQLPPEGAGVAGLLLSARGRAHLRPLLRPLCPIGDGRQARVILCRPGILPRRLLTCSRSSLCHHRLLCHGLQSAAFPQQLNLDVQIMRLCPKELCLHSPKTRLVPLVKSLDDHIRYLQLLRQ